MFTTVQGQGGMEKQSGGNLWLKVMLLEMVIEVLVVTTVVEKILLLPYIINPYLDSFFMVQASIQIMATAPFY